MAGGPLRGLQLRQPLGEAPRSLGAPASQGPGRGGSGGLRSRGWRPRCCRNMGPPARHRAPGRSLPAGMAPMGCRANRSVPAPRGSEGPLGPRA
eukprot:13554779-Alexandrium_andersonii.AAC.1